MTVHLLRTDQRSPVDPWMGLKDWGTEPLSELIDFIVCSHHGFIRREQRRVEQLLMKSCLAHGRYRPELARMQDLFSRLSESLVVYMLKEEQVLFPYIVQMEGSVTHKGLMPTSFFETVRDPVGEIMFEHNAAQEILQEIRAAGSDYALEPCAGVSFVNLYKALQAFEEDFQQHAHLENHVLFPRAVKMETEARALLQVGLI